MFTNKIIQILLSITAIIVIPIQAITTLILGLLVRLTFGLLLIPLSAIWIVLFYAPLLGLSYVYEKVFFLRPFISILGIPLAVLGDSFVALIPSMGEVESRYEKMIICQTFPYTWRYTQIQKDKIKIKKNNELNKVIKQISKVKVLNEHLGKLKIEIYARPSYAKGDCEIDW